MKRISAFACLFIITLVLLTAIFSCSNEPGIPVSLGKEFSLSIGQTATFSSEGITLKFLEVESDTRDPEDGLTSPLGEAICRVEVHNQKAKSTISIPQKGGTSFTNGHLGSYKLVTRLLPKPETGKTIAPADYKLFIIMTK